MAGNLNLDKNILYQEYVVKGRSLSKLSDFFNVCRRTLRKSLVRCNIKIRSALEQERLDSNNGVLNRVDISKDELYQEYVVNKKSITELKKIFNVTFFTIRKRLNQFNIPIRTHNEQHKINYSKGLISNGNYLPEGIEKNPKFFYIIGAITGDSLIQLSDGAILPIEDLNGPTSLISLDLNTDLNNIKSFCNHGSIKRNVENIYEIYASSKIKASSLHRFFRLNNFSIEEVNASNINVGDYVACAGNIDVNGVEQRLPAIEVPEMITISKEGGDFIKQNLIDLGLTRKEICENLDITPRQFRRVLNQGYATNKNNAMLLVHQGVSKQIYEFLEPYTSNKFREITIPETLNVELAQVLGYFLGDGGFEQHSLRFRDERLEVLEVYDSLFKKLFNLSGTITKVNGKNCYNLSINSVVIKGLFIKLIKQLFVYISRSPNEHIKSFIKGFMDAEGFISKKRPTITIGQKNEKILRYLQLLLLRLGIRSRLDKSSKEKTFYILQLDGQYFLKFAEEIGVSASDKLELMNRWMEYCKKDVKSTREIFPVKRELIWNLLKQLGLHPSRFMKPRPDSYEYITKENIQNILNKISNLKCLKIKNKELVNKLKFLELLINGDVRFERVRKIEVKENKEHLFDISVPVIENYIANGFIVHNSTYRVYLRKGKKGTRVAKMIDAPHLPESEARFKITEQGIRDVDEKE